MTNLLPGKNNMRTPLHLQNKSLSFRLLATALVLLTTTPGHASDELQSGASGRLVENLQRTLNVRLKPSPGLAVDGDFGPNTKKVVMQFQSLHKIPASGIVDAATWKALGPLITQTPSVPTPAAVNKQKLPRKPADSLNGTPFVTCKAWAIADAKTGKLLWGSHENKPLDMASTTKIMTAYLVLGLAQTQGEILNETITFSRQADETGGSTAGVRAGESLSVRELLYGLMLPSGNDASVALAEHFGGRFAADRSARKATPFQRFIIQMNRRAKQLGMTQTRFANPHGLTAEDHHTTASDLLRLAYQAMQLPAFRQTVGTRQHGCTLTDQAGKQRNVVWKNTNRLLAIEDYLGVKTGTTSAAGACLVSCAQRGNRQLLMVVLGASSSDARYTDARNLYRWAWQQLK
jgi:D-alanyl-D-alanine carboxypeptidase (penicillin-binding protein 5/6)